MAKVLIDSSLINPAANNLFDLETIAHWLPAIVLAVLIYTLSRHIKNALLIPMTMLFATLGFYAVTTMLGMTTETLRTNGWLFEALPTAQQSAGISLSQFKQVEWTAVLGQSGSLILIAAVSAIAMLLNNSGFELSIKGEFDQNKDLRVTGIANFLAGLVGGWPGYISPALSAINARQGKQLPLAGFLAAVLTGFLLWHATQIIEMIPRFIVGATIAYVGVSFLFDWVIKPAKNLSYGNYAALLLMVLLFISLGQQI